jgi:predicted O-methyltransferase YrrM
MKCPNCQSVETRKHGFYRGKQRYQCKICARQFVETHTADLHQQPSTGVEEQIDRYIRSTSTASNDLLLDLQRDTAEYPLAKMQPTLAQVQSIALLMQSMGVSRVLEIGIFSSYATVAMAAILPEHGRLVSCGVDGAHLAVSRGYWQQAGVAAKIDFHIGNGLDLLDSLLANFFQKGSANEPLAPFDAIVISGLKHQYSLYYQRAIELLRPNGLLFATDVLWQGKVLNLDAYNDDFTTGIDRFNRELAADNRVRVMVLPIGDGLSLAIKL